MTIKHAHVLEGHLEYSSLMPRPARWVKAEDYEVLWNSATREVGWLVEDGGTLARPRYRTMDQTGIHWTEDHNKAIRFARRADAEMFAAGDEDAWRITEHMWVNGSHSAAAAEPPA